MTLEEKVGQIFMVASTIDDAREVVEDLHVGGIIYYGFANDLTSPESTRDISKTFTKYAKHPLLIATDQEGGRVARLKFLKFPANADIKTPDEAKHVAYAIGSSLKNVGVNMNLAPVIDVNSNPQNPIIGNRAFSSDPDEVIAFAREALLGYKQAGVFSVLKHYPGHGDTKTDSHIDLPTVDKSLQELEEVELLPFKELAPIADAIMTAHILVPAMDPDFPATLSKKILGYLRKEIGFDGVIVSDSLVMQGVLEKCDSVESAAIQALNAGCDLLLFGGKRLDGKDEILSPQEIRQIRDAIVKAALHGRISIDRIDEAVNRVLNLKS